MSSPPGSCPQHLSPRPSTAGADGLSAAVLVDLRELEVAAREPCTIRPLLVDDLPVRVEPVARDPGEAQRPSDRARPLRPGRRRGDEPPVPPQAPALTNVASPSSAYA